MHNQYTMLMSLVLDREATPDQVAALRQHVAGCGTCAATWREWQALDFRLSEARPVAPPDTFMPGLVARLAERQAERRQRRYVALGLLLAWAGALFVMWVSVVAVTAWGYSHPLEISLLLTAAGQVLSNFTGLLNGTTAIVDSLGDPSLALGLACFACVTAALCAIWFWIMARSSQWNRPATAGAES